MKQICSLLILLMVYLPPSIGQNYDYGVLLTNTPLNTAESESVRRDGVEPLGFAGKDTTKELTLSYFVRYTEIPHLWNPAEKRIYSINFEDKIDPEIAEFFRMMSSGEKAKILVRFFEKLPRRTVEQMLEKYPGNENVLLSDTENYSIDVTLSKEEVTRFTKIPVIRALLYIDVDFLSPLNQYAQIFTGAGILHRDYGYTGAGIFGSIGDHHNRGSHPDFPEGSFIWDHNSGHTQVHGRYVTGANSGRGLADPLQKAVAPGVTTILTGQWKNMLRVGDYVQNYGLTFTSHSYGEGHNEPKVGTYRFGKALDIDQITLLYPTVNHFWAVGNSGGGTNFPYVAPYNTILWTHMAKNRCAVGMLTLDRIMHIKSSAGPTKGGGMGVNLVTLGRVTVPGVIGLTNLYQTATGTSLSTPVVAGIDALITQASFETFGFILDGGLRLAMLYASADPLIGDTKPSYKAGYGSVDAHGALQILENEWFDSGVFYENGELFSVAVPIPDNAIGMNTVLYWMDEAGQRNDSLFLIQDLNMKAIYNGMESFPLNLNPHHAHVRDPPSRGKNNVDNHEYIRIELDPASEDTLHLEVEAFDMLYTPGADGQKFYIAYEFEIEDHLEIMFPNTGSKLLPGHLVKANFESTLKDSLLLWEYSLNGGTDWNTIGIVSSKAFFIDWMTPESIFSDEVILKATGLEYGISDTTGVFSILERPELKLSGYCPSVDSISWDSILGARNYIVYRLVNGEMITLDTVSETLYPVRIEDIGNWMAVSSLSDGGTESFRSIAIDLATEHTYSPDLFCDCATYRELSMISIESIDTLRGRKYTSSELNNLGVRVALGVYGEGESDVTIGYRVNDGGLTVLNVPIESSCDTIKEVRLYPSYSVSEPGKYEVVVWVIDEDQDQFTSDDTLAITFHQIPNPRIDPITGYTQRYLEQHQFSRDTFLGPNGFEAIDVNCHPQFGHIHLGKNFYPNMNQEVMIVRNNDPSFQAASSISITVNTVTFDPQANTKLDLSLKHRFHPSGQIPPPEDETPRWFLLGFRSSDTAAIVYLDTITQMNLEYIQYSFENLQDSVDLSSTSFQIVIQKGGKGAASIDKLHFYQQETLPVAFGSMNGIAQEKENLIFWNTLSEFNTHGFEIESLLRATWRTIGYTVATNIAHGSSYEFVDTKPGTESYYRIKSIDFDQQTKTSEVIMVRRPITEAGLRVFPNPVEDVLYVQYSDPVFAFKIQDNLGRILISGNNKNEIDVSGLAPGIYVLKIKEMNLKFIKT
jgi:hypothetical protein